MPAPMGGNCLSKNSKYSNNQPRNEMTTISYIAVFFSGVLVDKLWTDVVKPTISKVWKWSIAKLKS